MPLPAVFLLSLVLLALQVVLMRALAFAQGHHLASVVLSVALLGFGAGGSVLTLFRKRAGPALESLCAPAMLLCAVSLAAFSHPARLLLDGLEVDLLGTDPSQIPRVVGLGLVMFFPFFFGALALSAAFSARPESIGRLYAANLAGSAVGAGGVLLALGALHPEQLLPLLALCVLLGALWARPPRPAWLVTALITALAGFSTPSFPLPPYKSLSQALRLPGAQIKETFPHARGRVDLLEAPALRHAPDLSLLYAGTVPAPPHLFVDGGEVGVTLTPGQAGADILHRTPRGVAFHGLTPRHALLIEPGGTAALAALSDRAERITLLESHPRVARLLAPFVAEASHELIQADPRPFLARGSESPPDLIVFPGRGMFGGPTGLHTLGEDTLFTVEGIRAAWRTLAPDGRLSFLVWLDEPSRHAPRVVDLVGSALRAEGIALPSEHVFAMRGWGSLSVLVTRQPFGESEHQRVRDFAGKNGFDLLWPPGDAPRTHAGGGGDLDGMLAALLGPHPGEWLDTYRFDVRAPTDDRPFFNQFIRWNDRGEDLLQLSLSERGLPVLRVLVLLLALAAVVLVLGPLVPLRAETRRAPFTLLTFSGLGAGFMIWEVSLIHRLALLWGHPVTSAALVITSALAGMALGSLLSRNLRASPLALKMVLAGIVLMHLALTPLTGLLTSSLLASPLWARAGIAVLLAFVPAIPMGMPFPLGVRLLSGETARHIPWACGIDSALAVLAAPVASLLAYRHGFAALGHLATAAYGVALLGSFLSSRSGSATRSVDSVVSRVCEKERETSDPSSRRTLA